VKLIVSLAALMLAPAPLILAHHSFAAEYGSRLITLSGTITKFVWMNPHTRIYLDVTDARGVLTKWECEGGAPGGLVSNGWSKESLKPGDHVTIEGFPARDRSNICKVSLVKLYDGRRLTME
jgi:hypothetical protein